jgi:hypothetical protein
MKNIEIKNNIKILKKIESLKLDIEYFKQCKKSIPFVEFGMNLRIKKAKDKILILENKLIK